MVAKNGPNCVWTGPRFRASIPVYGGSVDWRGADPPRSSVRVRRRPRYRVVVLEDDLFGGKQRPEMLQAFGNVHTPPNQEEHRASGGS